MNLCMHISPWPIHCLLNNLRKFLFEYSFMTIIKFTLNLNYRHINYTQQHLNWFHLFLPQFGVIVLKIFYFHSTTLITTATPTHICYSKISVFFFIRSFARLPIYFWSLPELRNFRESSESLRRKKKV